MCFSFVFDIDVEFTSRLKEDQKYLSKGTNRKPLSRKYSFANSSDDSVRCLDYQEKPDDFSDNPLDEYEMSKVMARRGRSANKTNSSEVSNLIDFSSYRWPSFSLP